MEINVCGAVGAENATDFLQNHRVEENRIAQDALREASAKEEKIEAEPMRVPTSTGLVVSSTGPFSNRAAR